jgi:hypothetical protein
LDLPSPRAAAPEPRTPALASSGTGITPLLAFAALTMPVNAGSPFTEKIGWPLLTAFWIALATTFFFARVTYRACV